MKEETIFQALSNAERLKVYRFLCAAARPLRWAELKETGVSTPNLVYHIKMLQDAAIVERTGKAGTYCYEIAKGVQETVDKLLATAGELVES